MNDTNQSAEDLAILEQLNLDYNEADQHSDAARFRELLADDFVVQTPGVTRNRDEYLEYIAQPRPFKDLALVESRIRLFDDIALIHGRARYTLIDGGSSQEALYTDAYQKREGKWVCISACAIAPGA
ncbi:nuclear transport factor 2 family protein [Diaminobutyricibacter tongyongensis]|uniref:Nuclear transport factor 2 family protein n=1 Tax=Leifsonia tongyongensis TaxID=1268043 RepID=A0A6L9Y290_9MICO|nr:nuclear transport factor 2 family protein [Diaminobutyricibacter tongyongensis]NEN07791.1 nuclear transport factor 2 family protein [Diaminobutyricibacter tongyongensis]